MEKLFLCKWGDWDEEAMNSYQPKTQEVTEDFFLDGNGYEEEDIEAVTSLEVGEQYDATYGNHTISRIR